MNLLRALPCAIAVAAFAASPSYRAELSAWHEAREAELRSDTGWLTVAGLFWLRPGANTFGRESSNNIVITDGPGRAGAFILQQGRVLTMIGGVRRELRPDTTDRVRVGRLNLFIIRRGNRYGVRLKDPQSEFRQEFRGIDCFPPNEAYRITARFVAEPRKIPVLDVIGETQNMESPGYAEFELNGQQMRLYPVLETSNAKQLFFVFRDLTSGHETYGAGRFLDADMPRDGKVVLDFNKAYNPPCAFTPYATCPLPPKENRLPVRIEAGEQNYGH